MVTATKTAIMKTIAVVKMGVKKSSALTVSELVARSMVTGKQYRVGSRPTIIRATQIKAVLETTMVVATIAERVSRAVVTPRGSVQAPDAA